MQTPFEHAPVLRDEVVALVARCAAPGPAVIVDATLGGGGHAEALLRRFPQAQLVGIDRDPHALAAAGERLAPFGARVRLCRGRFSQLRAIVEQQGYSQVDAVVVDLGVSSYQLDSAARGFSFRAAGPLDMRMDPDAPGSAAELLATIDVAELTRILRELGEERHARRVARRIVERRPADTAELARVVQDALRGTTPPGRRERIDPATRTFQALRMAVNDEVGELEAWLREVPALLAPGGVAVAISFHSIEDRLVKRAFKAWATGCVCPPRLPVCVCGQLAAFEILTTRPLRATAEELLANPRARSAKVRAARRLGAGAP